MVPVQQKESSMQDWKEKLVIIIVAVVTIAMIIIKNLAYAKYIFT